MTTIAEKGGLTMVIETGWTLEQLSQRFNKECYVQFETTIYTQQSYKLEAKAYTLLFELPIMGMSSTAQGNARAVAPVALEPSRPVESLADLEQMLPAVKIELVEFSLIESGSSLANGVGNFVVPPWLKAPLPRRVAPTYDAGFVDFSLPVDGNLLYMAMQSFISATETVQGSVYGMRESLQGNHSDHTLLVGSSGCGKSAACLSLASTRYLVYLQCASIDTGGKDPVWGYQMLYDDWERGTLRTQADVENTFRAEYVTRLLVLHQMLQQHGSEACTPLLWLRYLLSSAGSTHIRNVRGFVKDKYNRPTVADAFALSSKIEAIVGTDKIVLVVDELQQLALSSVPDPSRGAGAQQSVLNLVVRCARSLSIQVMWSGTRVGVSLGHNDISGIAKQYTGTASLRVTGQFEYLSSETVLRLLNEMLNLGKISSPVINALGYYLQGRARMLALFVSTLFSPACPTMKEAFNSDELSDEHLTDVLDYMFDALVVTRFQDELNRFLQMTGPRGMGNADVGYLWALTMLAINDTRTVSMNREDSLAFTTKVICEGDKYKFEYKYGEPGLQEALLRIVRSEEGRKRRLAELGIEKFMQDAHTASSQGQYMDYAVALSFLVDKDRILQDLLGNNSGPLRQYAHFQPVVERVVHTNTVKEQLEWFEKLLEDPTDCTFSMLPGIPVKNIALIPNVLSGADLICAAFHSTSAQVLPSETSLPRLDFPRASRTSGRKRAAPQDTDVHVNAATLLVHVCCANSSSDTVPSEKHLDQVTKSGAQFANEKRAFAADRYKKVASDHYTDNRLRYLPVLVEIPQNRPIYSDDYVLVTEREARVFFSKDLVDNLAL